MRAAALGALALLAVAVAARAHLLNDETSLVSPVPFVMSARYGRSPSASVSAFTSARGDRLRQPRADRFFMASRYGKRSGAGVGAAGARGAVTGAGGALLCEYTGVVTLYRCYHTTHRHSTRGQDASMRG